MLIAREGVREIALATVVLGGLAYLASLAWWPLIIPFALVWAWAVAFFRDPPRSRTYAPGDLCSPADGTITEITELDHHDAIGGPAIRIGMFLSIFNVHLNRAPCSGRVRSLAYRAGEFLDARHPESGRRNESNTILLDPEPSMPGPVEVRQVAGKVARRIICRVDAHQRVAIGERIGLIKFGSRTELVIPKLEGTQVCVRLGDKVKGALTLLARQPALESAPKEAAPKAAAPAREAMGTA
ncbi:MAG: phosphatidylserine decarboxylase [Phycisphaerales bacterium]|nr:phosphatidylserine decarboxylase [Phycisphaerales bacterium]